MNTEKIAKLTSRIIALRNSIVALETDRETVISCVYTGRSHADLNCHEALEPVAAVAKAIVLRELTLRLAAYENDLRTAAAAEWERT